MTSASKSAAGDPNPRYLDLRETAEAIIDKTRAAWISRPKEMLPLEAKITVSIGFASLTRGGWVIFEENVDVGSRPMTVAEAEKLAQRAPEEEWCIHFVETGQQRHYRRVGEAQWKLYRWGAGLGRTDSRPRPRRRIPHEPLRGLPPASSSSCN